MDAKKEEWRDVVGYEGLYKVSNLGNVYSLLSNKILSPSKNHGGYLSVQLSKDNNINRKYIHRLVALAFLGDPPEDKQQINHKDENKENNNVSNLEWISHIEN